MAKQTTNERHAVPEYTKTERTASIRWTNERSVGPESKKRRPEARVTR